MKKIIGEKIIIYTDGGSRGNPGEGAIGVVIEGIGREKKQYSQTIGIVTNNEAEYQAVIFALKKIKQLVGKEKLKNITVEIKLDSELVAKQLRGEYKIEEKNLQLLFMEVWNLRFDIPNVVFKHIPREQNKEADFLVNKSLNEKESTLF
ncbi:MAG: ribonuclease HI family protein [Patescibacteria group bacterium]|jgi:ribonuclease HI|nr:ribonuclease HI family protein [Patescibacteria group bacterium]